MGTSSFKIKNEYEVVTIAGSGIAGFEDGHPSDAQFNSPKGIAVESDNTIIIADTCNHRIRSISPQGEVNTVAGNGEPGYRDGTLSDAQFNLPVGIAVNRNRDIIVADQLNHCIRIIDRNGYEVKTLVGNGENKNQNPLVVIKDFYFPFGVAVNSDADIICTHGIYLHQIMHIDGKIAPLTMEYAGKGVYKTINNSNHQQCNVSPPLQTSIQMISVNGETKELTRLAKYDENTSGVMENAVALYVDRDDNIIICDGNNNHILILDSEKKVCASAVPLPPGLCSIVAKYVGSYGIQVRHIAGSVKGHKDGLFHEAKFYKPCSVVVAVDSDATIIVCDSGNKWIRAVTLHGRVKTLETPIMTCEGVAIDRRGNIILAHTHDHQIKKIIRKKNVHEYSRFKPKPVNPFEMN